ncbi:hypothetical protein BKP37_07210 [Anaerobacillus alkalilacustris]|uniref:YdbS-like PH domain-containing protein n=1 Tax=Anaerobacillus alkalilacustris TaxID=393763 RepID=A0A1S2LQH7_9BACI|nr:PH domain-containing protein [Anaerobacillus alkalilacustris]OIJ14761.1 hypothetical protein BKP37_07210 [Anaerobacillus alkalilacustris]
MFKGKRLHPVSIFFLSFSALKELLVPFFAAFIFGRGAAPMGTPFNLYFIIGVFLLLFIYGYLKWLTFTYEVNEKELEIKTGILVKKHRFIQKERVYSIDITSSVFQRLFHLVTVNIETAGGGHEPEVRLAAIRKQEAYKIKRKLLFKQSTEPSVLNDLEKSKASVDTLWTLTRKDLIITALTSSGIGIVFMAILALITQLENLLSEGLIVYTFGYLFESSVVVIIFILIIILIIAWLISILATLLKYGGFKIMKKGDEIEITRGLIEKRHLTLSLNRITAIRIVESVLRQPFGLATIYVESAGGGSKDEQFLRYCFL